MAANVKTHATNPNAIGYDPRAADRPWDAKTALKASRTFLNTTAAVTVAANRRSVARPAVKAAQKGAKHDSMGARSEKAVAMMYAPDSQPLARA